MKKTAFICLFATCLAMLSGCSASVQGTQSEDSILRDLNTFEAAPDFLQFRTIDIVERTTGENKKTESVICRLTADTPYSSRTYTGELSYRFQESEGWVLEDAEYSLDAVERKEEPGVSFDPRDAFAGIPYDSFEATWLKGGMTSQKSADAFYEETYDFILKKELAVIPYTVSRTVTQTCEYIPSENRWDVSYQTDDVIQEMDLSTYEWYLDESMFSVYTEVFVKTGPNTFASGGPDNPHEPYFTVDILNGGFGLQDESGNVNLPGGQWTARLYIEFLSPPAFTAEAAIDLSGGMYGYNGARLIVPVSEIARVKEENSKTEDDYARERLEISQQAYQNAAAFAPVESSLIEQCNIQLAEQEFGNVRVDQVSVALDSASTPVGWVIQSHSGDSFNGDVTVSVGIKSDGTIIGFDILSIQDTPGLGLNATKDDFKNQFIGKQSGTLTVTKSGNADDDEIDAISGASYTSAAVTNAVNAALYFVQNFAESLNLKRG